MKTASRFLILAAALPLFFGSDAVGAEELAPSPCEFGPLVEVWRGQVDCFRLTVPETRDTPETTSLDLAVYELKGRNGADGDPVVYLAGGPGVGAPEYVNLLLRHPLRDERSIFILEQRGIGGSGELCPWMRSTYYRRVAPRRDNDLRRRQFIGLLLHCFDQARAEGRNIDAYTTTESAADVADLRRALGLERMNIWAVSYGTILAQAYMRLEPGHVGPIAFDAAVPIDYAMDRHLTANFRSILDARWADCLAAEECDPESRNFNERLDRTIREYNRRPLQMLGYSPEPSIVVNYVYITGVDVAGIVFALLYERPTYEAIDRVLSFLERGSSSFLRAYYQRLAVPGFSYGMHFAVNCRGPYVSAGELDALREADRLLYDAMQVGFLSELCAAADLAAPGADDHAPVFHDGRVLVMAGEFDPITPLAVAGPLRERFSDSIFVEIGGAGHGPSRSVPCAQEMVRAFFDDPAAPVGDICENASAP